MIKPGDLIRSTDDGELGLVLKIYDEVEIPPLIEILWMVSNIISKTYQDDIEVLKN